MSRLCIVLLSFFIFASLAVLNEARYLPTRADDARLESIKQLLRELLERANGENGAYDNDAIATYDKKPAIKRASRSPRRPLALEDIVGSAYGIDLRL